MVYFYTNILIHSGFIIRISALLLAHYDMLYSFCKYANVEVYLIALTLLNVQLFSEDF